MPTNKRSELAEILRELAAFIERRSDDELAPLFRRAQNLVRNTRPQKGKNRPKAMATAITNEPLQRIADGLLVLQTREAGEQLLKEEITNREALEALARMLQLPVQRDDTIDRLRAKIVESSIGSRLRSEAIQGGGGRSHG